MRSPHWTGLVLACLLALGPLSLRAQQADPAIKEVQVAGDAFTRGQPLPDWSLPLAAVPADAGKGALQILLSESQMLAGDVQSALIVRAFRVNEQSALGDVGQYPVSFAPAYEKLHLHRLQIIRDGVVIDKTATVNTRFLQRETGLEAGIYSGSLTAMFLVDDLRVGDVLYIAYTKVGSNPVFGKTYSDSAAWDSGVATSLRRVSVLHPADRDIRWTMHGDGEVAKLRPRMLEHQGRKVLQFEERNIAAVTFEPYAPSDYMLGRWLQFTEYRNWQEVAQWGQTLFPPKPALPAELQQALTQWRQLPDEGARAAAALRWVQDQIRYFSVSIGESSHRPSLPEEVVRRRYGDCKDKTWLLVSLLRELGIQAAPILVNASAIKAPSRNMPTPGVFDHVLVQARVAGKTYYLDGTRSGQRGPIERMGMGLQGATGLLLAEGTRELTVMTPPEERPRLIELNEKYRLDSFGKDARLVSVTTYRNLGAEAVRNALPAMSVQQKRQMVLSDYERRYPGIKLEGEPAVEDNEALNEVTIRAQLSVPNLAAESRGDWVMRFFPANMSGIIRLPPQMNRSAPAQLGQSGYAVGYQIEVTWPDSVAAMMDPITRRVSNDWFVLDVQRGFRGNVASAQVNFEQRADVVAPRDLPKLLEEMRNLERAIGGVMVVGKEQIKAGGFLGIGKASLQDTMKQRLEKTVTNVGKVIADKSLSGDDLAQAHCERASALADLGRHDEALVDAEAAIKAAPSLGDGYACRQVVHYAAGRFEASIQDAGKALSLGADAGDVLYRRGLARFFLNAYEPAAADFARAAEVRARKQEEGGLYQRLWQAVALLRGGKALPEQLTDLARKEARGLWPRPALALMAGLATPEQVQARASEKGGDEALLNGTEAWFFVGQWHLARGQIAEARSALQKVRDNGIVMYIEHVAAGFELARLK